jgi:hypothetical protein
MSMYIQLMLLRELLSEMHQRLQKLPAKSEMVLKIRKYIKTASKLVLDIHIRSQIHIKVTWQTGNVTRRTKAVMDGPRTVHEFAMRWSGSSMYLWFRIFICSIDLLLNVNNKMYLLLSSQSFLKQGTRIYFSPPAPLIAWVSYFPFFSDLQKKNHQLCTYMYMCTCVMCAYMSPNMNT